MKRIIIVLTGLAVLGCIVALGLVGGEEPKTGRNAVVKGNNAFAFDLYAKLREKDGGNLFFSPMSISSAFGMCSAGARGETLKEMEKALHFDLEQDKLHPAYAELLKQLNGAGRKRSFQLTVANALWGQKDYGFRPEYLNLTKDNYGAGLHEVDFIGNANGARKTINQWVEKETKDKIKDLIPEGAVDDLTRLVLTNAIYFKASWAHQFSESSTKKESFKLPGGKKIDDVPLMRQNHDFRYYEGDTFQLLELPYEAHELSMLVLLPKKVDGLPELEKALTASKLEEWAGKMKIHDVDTTLPKFKFTSEFRLNDSLAQLGMKLAFTPNAADFSGMATGQKLYISAALHKAFVDVHEKGTEAAAATGLVVGTTSLPPPRPKAVFRADHPFVFAIRENSTGSVLFLGRVTNPS